MFFTNLNPLGTAQVEPCVFWKGQEHMLPVLASVARDVLSIPATGAGVERLFNSARDICHYRRGSLKPTTIQDLVMYMCATRFDLEEQQLESLKQLFSKNEREAADEERDAENTQDSPEAISDTEEDDLLLDFRERGISIDVVASQHVQVHTQVDALLADSRKGEKVQETSIESGTDDDDGNLPVLRDNPRKRSSGRVCIPSKRLRGYDVY